MTSGTSQEQLINPTSGGLHKITFESVQLKRQQKVHAILLMIIIPTLGSIAAVLVAIYSGVSLVEVSLLLVMYFLTSLGITLGYHRLFAHRSFQTSTSCKVVLGILGSMSCQGPLIYWVSSHRRHHNYSDVPGDPHSPFIDRNRPLSWWHGFYHSHMGWTYNHELTNPFVFSKDLVRDFMLVKVNKHYYTWVMLGLAIPTVLGALFLGSWMGALKGLLWGGLLRMFLVHHSSWTIGSIAHLYGKSPFKSQDKSKNNIWIALPTLGEGWHNNHHAFPNSAFHGLKWWQIDITGWVIYTLNQVGLVWDVKRPSLSSIEAKIKCSPSGEHLT
jgi:stearoyl-CoA desaturase (Delta-9 desaturase)